MRRLTSFRGERAGWRRRLVPTAATAAGRIVWIVLRARASRVRAPFGRRIQVHGHPRPTCPTSTTWPLTLSLGAIENGRELRVGSGARGGIK